MARLRSTETPVAESATDLVTASLRAEIERGSLESGEALRQDELATRFGTSRIPVREALRVLQAEGLVTYLPNRGAVVATVSDREVQEMLEVRIALECHAIRLAVPNLVEADVAAGRAILRDYDASPNPAQWSAMNWAFHWCLYQPCECGLLLAAIERNFKQFSTVARNHISRLAGKERPQAEHHRLMALAEAGRAADAANLLRDHIAGTQRLIRAAGRGR